jgi:hypothetical protein
LFHGVSQIWRSVVIFDEEYMMAWPGELGEQARKDWHSRSAKKRAELSLSIEETLADDSLEEDPFSDELEELEKVVEPVPGGKSTVIIPPRLSLQSKPMPVVRVQPREPIKAPVVDSLATPESVEVPPPAQKKRRLAGRTTKVHLQAVPKAEKKSDGKVSLETEKNERSTGGEAQSGVKNNARRSSRSGVADLVEGQVISTARGTLVGSGLFKPGQREVTVANATISPSSVVVVTLVGDPGPVVVKYISLQPQIGFTIHLSAQAEAETPFNYVVLMGEVC